MMLGALAAFALSAAPATLPLKVLTEQVLSAKKKKKGKEKEKEKEKEAPAETSEGLDLSKPEPAPEAAPSAEPSPVAEEAAPETKPAGAAWSLTTPATVGVGANVLEAGVGWPGVYAAYWRGILAELDVGAKVGFNWGFEGVVTAPVPGLRIQAQARYKVWDNGSLSLGVTFAPGAIIYFLPGAVRGGVLLPLTGVLGLPNFVPKLNLSVTLEIPFYLLVGFNTVLPFMLGANGEYAINDSLLVFAKLKPLGVALFFSGGLRAYYIFEASVGVGYHL